MEEFDMNKVEILSQTKNTLIVRTSDLLPTLMFMQSCGWKLWELTPDDEDGEEYNILTYYKPKKGN